MPKPESEKKPLPGFQQTVERKRVTKLMREYLTKEIYLSKYDAGIIVSLDDIIALFKRFIEDDLQFNKNHKDMEYKCELSYAEFYSRKTEIAKLLIDVAMLLKVSKPHLKYLHSDVPKMFREALNEIDIEGKKSPIYKLLSRVIEYQYEIVSALTSGRSSAILESVDMDFLDTLKVYREALKSIDSKKWIAYVILQAIVKHSGGEPMTLRDIELKTGLSNFTVRENVNELFDKCKEILVVGQRGMDRTILIPPVYAKYEHMKQ